MKINKLEVAAVTVTILCAFAGCVPSKTTETTTSETTKSTEATTEASSEASASETTNAYDIISVDPSSDVVDNLGGWEVNSGELSIEDNADAKLAFETATEELAGASYEPIALLGTQVVAGTNYCILCRESIVVPDSVPTYAKVYIYEDLEGNAEITSVEEVDVAPAN